MKFARLFQLLTDYDFAIIGVLLVFLLVALQVIRVLSLTMAELRREAQSNIETQRQRELQRQGYCEQLGHDLDEHCLCRRCLHKRHDRKEIGREEYEDPSFNGDPGAMDLCSDFQPDSSTIIRTQYRCTRCGETWWDDLDA